MFDCSPHIFDCHQKHFPDHECCTLLGEMLDSLDQGLRGVALFQRSRKSSMKWSYWTYFENELNVYEALLKRIQYFTEQRTTFVLCEIVDSFNHLLYYARCCSMLLCVEMKCSIALPTFLIAIKQRRAASSSNEHSTSGQTNPTFHRVRMLYAARINAGFTWPGP